MSTRQNRRARPVDISLPRTLHDLFVADLQATLQAAKTTIGGESPSGWKDASLFKIQYLEQQMLSKLLEQSKDSAALRRSLAIEKFIAMEERNLRTNARLAFQSTDFGPFDSGKLVKRIRAMVELVLGDVPLMSELSYSGLDGMFTNGASTRVKRGPVAIAQKFVGKAHATTSARHLFQEELLPDMPLWTNYLVNGKVSFEEVDGSVMFTVPKNSVIDRVACKEPEINMYLQKGVGNHIRRRLREVVRIDLNDQSANRGLARLGSMSKSGHALATIDLTSASDLISRELVRLLLPTEWFELLDSLRSKKIEIDGVQHDTEMFSSMGNGFTFELESLLFYSIAKAVCYLTGTRGRISVYGDDIILPADAAGLLGKVFSWFGFIVNTKKSFWRGPFRESCGGHYHGGCDVTPFFIRKRIESQRDLILILNQLRAWATQKDCVLHFLEPKLNGLWAKYAIWVPYYLYGGKDCADNSALVTNDAPRKKLSFQKREVKANADGALLHWLRGREEAPEFEGFITSCGYVETVTTVVRNRNWERTLPLSLMWWEEVFS